jgi:hypothetical protein
LIVLSFEKAPRGREQKGWYREMKQRQYCNSSRAGRGSWCSSSELEWRRRLEVEGDKVHGLGWAKRPSGLGALSGLVLKKKKKMKWRRVGLAREIQPNAFGPTR